MSRLRVTLACAILAFLCRVASAQSTTLFLSVFSPSPPITDTDPIQLDAATAELVFPDTGHDIISSVTVNGFDIDWDMTSYQLSGFQAPVVLPFETRLNLGPLAPGTYNVQADWQNVNALLIPGAPTSGTGSLSITVVPRGDVNFDGHVNAKDIAAMMQALTNETGYAQSAGVSKSELETVGDVNMDGKLTNADLQKLLNVLKTGGGSADPVPEPSTLTLLALGAIAAFSVRRRIR